MTVCPTCGRPMAEPVAAGRNTMTGSTQSPWGHVLGNVPRLPDFSNDINAKTSLKAMDRSTIDQMNQMNREIEERGGIGGILRNAKREYDRLAEEWAGVSPSDYVPKIPGNILTGRRTPIDPAMQTSSYRPNTTNTGSVVSPMTSSAPANPMDGWISRQQNNAGVGGNSLWDMWRNRIGR